MRPKQEISGNQMQPVNCQFVAILQIFYCSQLVLAGKSSYQSYSKSHANPNITLGLSDPNTCDFHWTIYLVDFYSKNIALPQNSIKLYSFELFLRSSGEGQVLRSKCQRQSAGLLSLVTLELSLKSLEILYNQSNPYCIMTIWISSTACPFV